jgi:hypothetical protein
MADPAVAEDSEFPPRSDQGERGRGNLVAALVHELAHLLGRDPEPDA